MMSTQFIFVRHGEPRYDEVQERGYFGMGYDLGKLTERGVIQAEQRALDPIFEGAELIIASPYTRALQTAAIISRVTQIPLTVENDLHEWMPDTKFLFDQDIHLVFQEYWDAQGKRNVSHKYRWESYEDLQKRVQLTLIKYKNYKKVVVVCHGIVMSTMTRFDDVIEHCGVREVTL
ncbi:MAG: histidine phosphatase family protein [Tenericutes bacterium HGW-Tenericutes-3]|nr:MAG: histidine phosphatase family protein [Tenericutes bacterium HGW-Tenericutes-3]